MTDERLKAIERRVRDAVWIDRDVLDMLDEIRRLQSNVKTLREGIIGFVPEMCGCRNCENAKKALEATDGEGHTS